jgi:hypothetical protein
VLDLHLFPLHIVDSVEQAYLPGLHFASAPKGSARARQSDQLILLFSSIGELVLTSDRLQSILLKSTDGYFSSSGTVTAGLRKCAEIVNDELLEYNLKESMGSKQQSCMLNMVVRREDHVYVAHCGYTHTFVLSARETQHFFDPEGSGRGLGLSRSLMVRFFLSEIASHEYLICSPEPLATWTPSNLGGSPANALDYVRRRLLNQVSPNLRAVLIQAIEGSGKTILEAPLSSKTAFFPPPPASQTKPTQVQTTKDGRSIPVMATQSREIPLYDEPLDPPRPNLVTGQTKIIKPLPSESIRTEEFESEQEPNFLDGLKAIQKTISERATKLHTSIVQRFPGKGHTNTIPGETSKPRLAIHLPQINSEPIQNAFGAFRSRAGQAARTLGDSLQVAGDGMGDAVGNAVDYVTPEGGFKLPRISNTAMLFIAIAIPLVVAATGSSIYFGRGRSTQFEMYYQQAQAVAAQASGDKDPGEVRSSWQQALALLDQAEKYGKSEKSTTLREQAQDVLDDVDGIARIDFTSAILDGLPASVNITRIRSTTTDLYMLDSTDGKIIRALMTGRGYEVDESFKCSPGPYGSYTVGSFVDLALMPRGNTLGASVAALDASGNIVYCSSGSNATSMTLISPEIGWGKITGMAIDSGKLYVLDPESNTIWVYYGSNGTFSESPNLFFDEDVPNLSDISDFSISGNDLYLLHTDGHLTTCAFSDISGTPTKCKDPTPYSIKRPGVENKPVIIPDTQLTQIQYSTPPDPSLYLLDSQNVSIYHLSLKMALQKQLSVQAGDPQNLLKKKVTAFCVNPAKVLFLAFGNRVYTGIEP